MNITNLTTIAALPTGGGAAASLRKEVVRPQKLELVTSGIHKLGAPGSPWVLSLNQDAWINTETGQEISGLQILQRGFPMGGDE